jgi:hypothetical protein
MQGRVYTVEMENQTIASADGDGELFEFSAADDQPIELVGLHIYTTTEVQEAEEEWIRLKVIRGHTTSATGTSTTPQLTNPNDGAAAFTAEIDAANLATGGTAVDLHSFAFQVRNGLEFWWPEGCGLWTSQAEGLLVIRNMAAVTDDVSMNATAYIREF